MSRKNYKHINNDKKTNSKIHFKNRCLLRVGEELSQKKLIRSMRNNELEFVGRQSNRISKFRYEHNNNHYIIFYDKLRGCFVTIVYDHFFYEDHPELAPKNFDLDEITNEAIQELEQEELDLDL